MQNGGSERVRMTAALRLADVLLARDAREQAELRRKEPDASADVQTQTEDSAPVETSNEDERVNAAFAFLKTSNAG